MSASYLTHSFLTSKGVELTKPLKDWVTRASYLAKNRGSPQETKRYELWALQVIETAMQNPGGVQAVKWASQSPVMPPNTPMCHPALLDTQFSLEDSTKRREEILTETLSRCPAEIRPFVTRAFELYDAEVATGKRSYLHVSFLEMMNIAKNLHGQAVKQRLAAPPQTVALTAHQPIPPSPSVPLPVPKVEQLAKNRKRAREASSFQAEDVRFFTELLAGTKCDNETVPTFVGESTKVKRMYSRYEPTVEDIRPLPVLVKAFRHIKRQAREREKVEGGAAAMKFLSEQLKGMRQDIRVQNLHNAFTVAVYEFHARLCLQMGEVGEFNQCQAALKTFYASDTIEKSVCCVSEFFCYRLTYLFLSHQYDSLSTELINYTNAQSQEYQKGLVSVISSNDVARTLALCNACHEGDCLAILQLLISFPEGMASLVRIYLQRMRIKWLQDILCGVRGTISLRFLTAQLGYLPLHVKRKPPFWIDGDEKRSKHELEALFSTLKMKLPTDLDFSEAHKEDYSRNHTDWSINTPQAVPCVDAAVAKQAVENYVAYLSTRKDANI